MDLEQRRALRPPVKDMAIAAGFLVLGQAVTWRLLEEPQTYMGSRGVNAVFNLLLMGALAWRRRAPLAAVSWAVIVYFLPHAVILLDTPFLAGAVPLIVLTASAGYYCRSRPKAVIAAAVATIGLMAVTLSVPSLRTPEAFAVNVGFLLVPWLGARGLRERQDRASRLASTLAVERATKEDAVRAAAAEERSRIARELHDIVAHSVSMMVIQIGAGRMQMQAGAADAAAPLLEAEDLGRQALDDLRRLLGVLRTHGTADTDADNAPQPGLSELDPLFARARTAGLHVDVDIVGEPVELSAALDLNAYRIVQESLTNIVKFGEAQKVSVRICYRVSSLVIDVIDDGTSSASEAATGHGLIGMAERVSLFGGTFEAGPRDGDGWRVHVEFPLASSSMRDRASLFRIR